MERKESLLNDLRKTISKQRQTQDTIRERKRARAAVEHTLNKIRSKYLVEISQLRSQDGKSFYPNESARAAAVEEKLSEDKKYQTCREVADKLDQELTTAKLDADAFTGELKVLFLEGEILVAEITAGANTAVIEALRQ